MAVAYFKILVMHFATDTEETYDKLAQHRDQERIRSWDLLYKLQFLASFFR